MKNLIAYIKTYGCQMNIADSARIATVLKQNNIKITSDPSQANIIIVNTCSVRQKAEDKAIGWTNYAQKQYSPQLIIFTGCMVRRAHKCNTYTNSEQQVNHLKQKLPKNTLFLDIRDVTKIGEILKLFLGNHPISSIKQYIHFQTTPQQYLTVQPKYTKLQAYIPIMTGCNLSCAYCIVPYARGEEYFRSAHKILQDIEAALKNGVKHITLVGQIVNKWHYKSKNFVDLLKTITQLPYEFWLTFTSPHPSFMNNDILQLIASNPKVTKSLGLPLQSASNKILKSMNRTYTIEQYDAIIKTIKYLVPNIYLTTDIIVGYPNETQDDYNKTYKYLQKAKFSQIFVAEYSERSGTAAEKFLEDNIPKEIKKQRKRQILQLIKKQYKEYNSRQIGTIVKVLVLSTKHGVTYYNQHIDLENASQKHIGQFVNTKIIQGNEYGIIGSIITYQ